MDQTGRITLRPCRYSRLAGAFVTHVAQQKPRTSDARYHQPHGDSAGAELARPHDFGVEPFDSGAAVLGIGGRPSRLQMDEPAPSAEGGAEQDANAIDLNRQRELVERAAIADPGIHVTRAPVIGSDSVGPTAVSAVHLGEVGAPERPIFPFVKTVAAADILGSGGRNLHRSLRPVRIGAPHVGIATVVGLGPFDRVGHSVERRRSPQLGQVVRRPTLGSGRAARLGHRPVVGHQSTDHHAHSQREGSARPGARVYPVMLFSPHCRPGRIAGPAYSQ